MLKPKEKLAIRHRKALERICRYPTDELHRHVPLLPPRISALDAPSISMGHPSRIC